MSSSNNAILASLDDLHQKVNLILRYLNVFYEKDNIMSYDLSSLVQAVQNEKTVEASLVALVQGLSQKVASMAANVIDDSTKATLADLANELNANATAMSTAVTANTPTSAPVTTDPTPATPTTGTDATTVNPPAADSTVSTS